MSYFNSFDNDVVAAAKRGKFYRFLLHQTHTSWSYRCYYIKNPDASGVNLIMTGFKVLGHINLYAFAISCTDSLPSSPGSPVSIVPINYKFGGPASVVTTYHYKNVIMPITDAIYYPRIIDGNCDLYSTYDTLGTSTTAYVLKTQLPAPIIITPGNYLWIYINFSVINLISDMYIYYYEE